MPMNLLTSSWLPVRRRSGARVWIAPVALTEALETDPVVALDFPRPDWNAAVTEFLIGVLLAAFEPRTTPEWAALWRAPPAPADLALALGRLAFAFEVYGPAYAFQDFAPLADAEAKDVAQLLIDAPGAITVTKNTDLFIKRSRTPALCLPYTIAALITLQAYAPSGGAGHRTSMRGGGPMTALVEPPGAPGLWHRVWANVPRYRGHSTKDWQADDAQWATVFPWLALTLVSDRKQEIGPGSGHEDLLPFFACPRRIRLQIEANGVCGLGGTSAFGFVGSYMTQNYGANYTNWRHPLTPYRQTPKGESFPLHPGVNSRTFRDWLGIWGSDANSRAEVITLWQDRSRQIGRNDGAHIRAAGYDMDNMKARAWVEARLPLYAFSENTDAKDWLQLATWLVNGAIETARALGQAVRQARAGQIKVDDTGKVEIRVADNVKDELSADVTNAFWADAEAEFVAMIDRAAKAEDPTDPQCSMRNEWLETLKAKVLARFDRGVGWNGDAVHSPEQMQRLIIARQRLTQAFSGHHRSPIGKALDLPVLPKKGKTDDQV